MPALIFDCDGVLADTERDGHRPAFNETFAEVGLPVSWSEEEYGEKLKIGGGKERMASLLTDEFVRANGLPTDADGQREVLADWHKRKTARYKAIVLAGRLPARPGIARIVDEALDAGWTLAVASTSAEESVRAVLEHAVGSDTASRFSVFAGDVVPAKKPDPAIYNLALERLSLMPGDAIVIEDSRNGLLAAVAAGLRCVVTVSSYTAEEDMSEAVLVVSSLGDPGEPAVVLANRGAAEPGELVTLADLDVCRTQPLLRQGGCMSEQRAAPARRLVVGSIAQTAVDNETYFCELDAVVGDGDFGYSLARGFEVVLGDWDAMEYSDVGGLLKKTAIVLSKRIGGTSGPIWGTAFLRAGGCADEHAGAERRGRRRRDARLDRGNQAARQHRSRRQDAARRPRPRRRRARGGAGRRRGRGDRTSRRDRA